MRGKFTQEERIERVAYFEEHGRAKTKLKYGYTDLGQVENSINQLRKTIENNSGIESTSMRWGPKDMWKVRA